MNAIEKKARKLLAAEYYDLGHMRLSDEILEGKHLVDDAVLRAIVRALTPPEGYVLVPVEMTKEIGATLDESIKHQYSAESAWDLAIHAACQEVS